MICLAQCYLFAVDIVGLIWVRAKRVSVNEKKTRRLEIIFKARLTSVTYRRYDIHVAHQIFSDLNLWNWSVLFSISFLFETKRNVTLMLSSRIVIIQLHFSHLIFVDVILSDGS